MAVDKENTHIILHDLALNPEKAVALANMDSRSRIAELTRMTMVKTTIEKTPEENTRQINRVSRAPAPAPSIEPRASKEIDWNSDKASDDEFSRGFDQRMKERAERAERAVRR